MKPSAGRRGLPAQGLQPDVQHPGEGEAAAEQRDGAEEHRAEHGHRDRHHVPLEGLPAGAEGLADGRGSDGGAGAAQRACSTRTRPVPSSRMREPARLPVESTIS